MERNTDRDTARRRLLQARIRSLRSTADALERQLQALDTAPARHGTTTPSRTGTADAAARREETPLPIAAG